VNTRPNTTARANHLTLPIIPLSSGVQQITDLQKLSGHGAPNSQNLLFDKHQLNSSWRLQYSWFLYHIAT